MQTEVDSVLTSSDNTSIQFRGIPIMFLRNVVLAAMVVVSFAAAAVPASALTLINSYDFNGTLSDTLGNGPDMVNNGATLGPTGLTFGDNQGPTLNQATGTSYGIEMLVTLDQVNIGYQKLIDFSNLASDTGFYIYPGNTLGFYNINGGSVLATANTPLSILLSRAIDGTVTGYLGNVLSFSFVDGGSSAVATLLHFLVDDFATGQNEAASGFLDYIRIYDGPITPDTLIDPGVSDVPVPAALPLLISAIGGLGFIARRRARKAAA
jgi:hypothetical protein